MMKLEVKEINKTFLNKVVLNKLNLHVNDHEIVSVIGPSGVGKSTLFNIIAGLLTPTDGEALLDGESIIDQPGKVSYMLQKDLLLPYKTIEQNIALPLILQGKNKHEAVDTANHLLNDFDMGDVGRAYPKELSGGMRQRVALLRTYLFSSNLILLDEPFSALDTFTKAEIHDWYLDIHRELNLTTLFITHDIDEAIKLSDRVYILRNNEQEQLKEVVINQKSSIDSEEFELSEEFLEYKREIMIQLN